MKQYQWGWLAILAGISLTCVSWWQLCTESCAAAHEYRFFDLPFEFLGFSFFTLIAILHFFAARSPIALAVESILIAGALGAEVMFISFQKNTLHHWCPICLSIAACLCGLALSIYFSHRKKFSLKKMVPLSFTFALGLFLAVMGIEKPVEAFVGSSGELGDPMLGNKKSVVEVYILTDWFCPACRRLESKMDPIYPKLMSQASVLFIDRNFHADSRQFTPYNLSFLLNNKEHYLELRRQLIVIAKKTRHPTVRDVEEAIKPLGETYKPLDEKVITSGLHTFEEIADRYEVTQTPTLIVINKNSLQAEKLTGSEITEGNLFKAIAKLSPQ